MKRSYEKASQIFLTELPALNTGGRKDLKYFVMAPGCCSKQELRITNFFVSVQRNEGPESAVFAKNASLQQRRGQNHDNYPPVSDIQIGGSRYAENQY